MLKIGYSFEAEDFKSSQYMIPDCSVRGQSSGVAGAGAPPGWVLARGRGRRGGAPGLGPGAWPAYLTEECVLRGPGFGSGALNLQG